MSRYGNTRLIAHLSTAVGVVCACLGAGAHAAWVNELRGGIESRYDDNVRLSTDGQESAIATNVVGELSLRRVTESSEIAAIAGASYVTYSAYDGAEDLDNEDIQYLDIRSHTRGDRTQVGFDGSVRRDVLLETVGFIVDPIARSPVGQAAQPQPAQGSAGAPVADPTYTNTDAGSVEEQVRRIQTWASPYVIYEVSEKTGVRFGYTYFGLDYDQQATTGLEDSTTNALNVELSNQVSERDSARTGARVARFDPETDPDETDAYEVTVGWTRQFSDNTSAGIDLGAQRSERANESYSGYVTRLFADRRSEAGAIRGRYEHSLQPSGYGDLVKSDTLDVNYERSLSARLDLRIDGRAYRTRNSKDQTSNADNDRDYVEVGPTLNLGITEVFSLGIFYRYQWVDRKSDSSSGTSNAVGLTLSYRPQARI